MQTRMQLSLTKHLRHAWGILKLLCHEAGLEESTVRFVNPVRHLMFWDKVGAAVEGVSCLSPSVSHQRARQHTARSGRMSGEPRQT